MNSRKNRAVVCKFCRFALLSVGASAAIVPLTTATEPPQMLRWDIEATMISKIDQNDIFPDVRLGDPVRGTLMYDAARRLSYAFPGPDDGISFGYEHPRWIDVVSIVIDNPRTGGELRFASDLEADWADVEVGVSETEDWITAGQ